jgi:Ca-activated chloride channel homolog
MVFSKVKNGLVGLLITLPAYAQNDQSLILRGNEQYKKGAFDKAAEDYKKAADINKNNAKAQYNLGNALYKNKQVEEAAKAFEAAGETAADKQLSANALYNKGVTHSRQQQLMESIGAYKNALKLKPDDQQARENLQRAINELKKQPPPKQNDQQNQNKDQNKQEQKPQNNKSKLNEQQAERMLNALRQEEKRLQQDKQGKQPTGGMQEKDW